MTAAFIKRVLFLSFIFLSIIGFSQPVITTFSPTSAYTGASVSISGTGFNTTPAENIVFFGAVRATVLSASAIQLTVKVPVGASYHPISVATGGLVGFSGQYFVPSFDNNGRSDFTRDSFKDSGQLIPSSDGKATDIGVGDFDGDGKVDLLTTDDVTGRISLYKNISTVNATSFDNAIRYTTGKKPSYTSVTDVDGDGRLDVILVNYDDSSLAVYRNISTVGNISFAQAVFVSLPMYPVGLSVADFNGDGKQDFAIPVGGTRPLINIYKNTSVAGNISFSLSKKIVAESALTGIAASDFNNDGEQDIVVSYLYLNSVGVFRNSGTGGGIDFVKGNKFEVSNAPQKFKVADLDGNGKNDLLVMYSIGEPAGAYSVLLNKSAGTNISFGEHEDINPIFVFTDIAVGDLNGDSKPDLAMQDGYGNDSMSVYRNLSTTNTFSLAAPTNYSIAGKFNSAITDLNSDGTPDIAVLGDLDKISWLKNQFDAPHIHSFNPLKGLVGDSIVIRGFNLINITGVSFGGVAAASFIIKNESTIVAVLGAAESGNVSVSTSKHSSSLPGFWYVQSPPFIGSFSPKAGIVGATVTVNGKYFGSTIAENKVFFGAVRANVVSAAKNVLKVIVPTGATYSPLTVNSSGLVGLSNNPFIVTYPTVDTGFRISSFTPPANFRLGAGISDKTVAADLDGDGKVDIITANFVSDFITSGFSVLKNISNEIGTIDFAPRMDYISGVQPVGVCVGDVNGDGKPDILVADRSAPLTVFVNTSTIGMVSFKEKVSFGSTGIDIQVRDFNDDGMPDLILTNQYGAVTLYKNVGDANNVAFELSGYYNEGNGPGQSAIPYRTVVSDFDNNGRPDFCVLNEPSKSVMLFANTGKDGAIAFENAGSIDLAAFSPKSIAVGDLNLDGKPDLVMAASTGTQLVVAGNTSSTGIISFANISSYGNQILGTVAKDAECAVADMNGDGKPDVAMADGGLNILLFRNTGVNGNFSFAPSVNYEPGGNAASICAADFDNDGKTDLARKRNGYDDSTLIGVMRNQLFAGGVASFVPISAGTGANVTIKGTNFTGATAVSFGKKTAYTFTVVSDSIINATVGLGASGNVSVTSPAGTSLFGNFTFLPSFSTPPGIEWQRMVGTSEDERAMDIQPTKDGGYITAGYIQKVDSQYYYNGGDFYVAKLNEVGQVQWQKKYGTDSLIENAATVIEDAAGNFLIAGSRTGRGAGKYSTLLIKVDPQGSELSQKLFPQDNSDYYDFQQFISTADGGYMIVGAFDVGDGSRPYLLVNKFDSVGSLAWQKRFEQGADYITKIIQTADGGYAMTGRTWYSLHGSIDCYVLKLDSNGNMEWERSLGGSNNDMGDCITQLPDGGYIIAGNTASTDGDFSGNVMTGVWMAKLNAAGDIEWQKIVGEGQLFDVKALTEGGFVFTGGADRYEGNRGRDLWLIKAGDDGEVQWQKFIGGKGSDEARSIIELANGRLIVAGCSDSNDGDVKGGSGNNDFWIVKLGKITDINLCPITGTAILQAQIRGNNYRWQIDSGRGFVDIAETDTLYVGANDSVLWIPKIPSSWNGYKFRCLVDGNDAAWFIINFKNTWVATSNTDWNNTANWSCGSIPDANTDVTINSGNVIISSDAFCRSLIVRPGATVTVKPGYKLTVTH